MQAAAAAAAALCIAQPPTAVIRMTALKTKALSPRRMGGGSASASASVACRASSAAPAGANTSATVDYNSLFSVFPAEACEVIGGEACMADMFPEATLLPSREAAAATTTNRAAASEEEEEDVEKDYLHYDNPKTVFCAEACDDLGGEFCSREYQRGVY